MTGPVFVDTNVLVYRQDASNEIKQSRAGDWIAHLAHRRALRISREDAKVVPESVDILITNGTILTVDGDRRIVTDGAVAVRGDRIAAVGKTAEIEAAYTAEKTIDGGPR